MKRRYREAIVPLTQTLLTDYVGEWSRKRKKLPQTNTLPLEIWGMIWEYDGTIKVFRSIYATERRCANHSFWKHYLRNTQFKVISPEWLSKANLGIVTRF